MRRPFVSALVLGAVTLPGLFAQGRDRLTKPVDDSLRVVLRGNLHPMARAALDAGRIAPDTPMKRMLLVLRPDPAQEAALEALVAAQQDPESPVYHQWLTPERFGEQFGVSQADLDHVVRWLESRGFAVEPASGSRRLLLFSGTARQVEWAFQTEIHAYQVNGRLHHANASDPEIPAALAGVVGGIVSLHDFTAQPQHKVAALSPQFTFGGSHYLAPADFAAIYNLGPLYGSSTNGTGQSIAVVARSNIALADIMAFRSTFSLPPNAPQVIVNGTDPGIVSPEEATEAELDTEWAGAVAPNAGVQVVVSASTASTDGVALSAEYIVNHNLAPVVSLSFGSCEAAMGVAENQFWNALWQQAAAQGISVVVASGDSGAAGCDSPSAASALSGAAVNGLCSTPYSTCVGGTALSEAANPDLYWSANNSSGMASAMTYIPEVAWNESGLVPGGSDLWAGGGGASAIYAKPTWQAGNGVPSENHRYVPDLALSSAAHNAYLIVWNGQVCAVAGTSAAAPSFAGLLALSNGRQGARQGNVNPVLYTLAGRQTSGGAAVFHDITAGNNSVNGVGGYSAGAGYDPVTGLGSVDANLLVNAWAAGATPIPSLQLTPSSGPVSLVRGSSAQLTITASATGGFKNPVSLSVGSLPSGLTATLSPASFVSPGSGSSALRLAASAPLLPGTYTVTVNASGGGISQSISLPVTVLENCTYSLAEPTGSVSAAAGTYSIAVTAAAGCSWTAASQAGWITMAGASSSGSGSVTYSVSANNTTASRTAALTIAGLTFTVTQAGEPCSYSVTLGRFDSSAGGRTGSLSVSALGGCSWKATTNANWITITSASAGMGNGTVNFWVAANSGNFTRTGTLTVAGYRLAITERGKSVAAAVRKPSQRTR